MGLKSLRRKATKVVKKSAAVSKVVVAAASKNPYVMAAANAATGGQASTALTLYNAASKQVSAAKKIHSAVAAFTPLAVVPKKVEVSPVLVPSVPRSSAPVAQESTGIFGLGFLIF